MNRFVLLIAVSLSPALDVCAAPRLPRANGVVNGDFEVGADLRSAGWAWWSRDQKGSAVLCADAKSGERCVLVQYDGQRDWALTNSGRLAVKPGQYWLASAWVKCTNTAEAQLQVVALKGRKLLRWDLASAGLTGTRGWTLLKATAEVPAGCDGIYVRLIGSGRTQAWVDGVTVVPGQAPPPRVPKPKVKGWAATRVQEKLGRGMLAMPAKDGRVHVGWRLLASDPKDVAFNVYRAKGRARPVRLNAAPLRKTTDFVDRSPVRDMDAAYWVRAVVDGAEQAPSEQARVLPGAKPAPCVAIKLQGDYTCQKVGVADLDGDGRYDYVVKQPGGNVDPYKLYWKRSPETYKIEAYRHDGTFLWRRDLGWSIERGIWYSPYVVYDFDGDGRAEVAIKTGEGDPREPDGRVHTGPEYLSIWDGLTGKEKARVPWPSREGFRAYNYFCRNQIGVAFLDGKTPCLLAARGTYGMMKLAAYQFHGGKLTELWRWDHTQEKGRYRGQGAHFMHSVDVDGDGRDEVVLGSCVIDDNGDGLWTTGKGHPDHCYVGDIDPSRPGLEIYYGMETRQPNQGCCLVDARTGKVLWGIKERTFHVHSTGLCSDFDPLHPGMECYSGEKEYPTKKNPHRWLHSARGRLLANEKTWNVGLAPRAAYWDADLQRELIVGNRIRDFQGKRHDTRLEGRQIAWADVLGDWREEVITSTRGELRIYTTPIPAKDRRVCLMQDPIYRLDVAHLAMGYNQPPTTSYCISGSRAAVGLRVPQNGLRAGQTVDARVVLAAGADKALSGVVTIDGGPWVKAEPATVRVHATAGGVGEARVRLTLVRQPTLLGGVDAADVRLTFGSADLTLRETASVRIADAPLTGAPMAQAEAFSAQGGGEVKVRKDKVGASRECLSHWDAAGHWLEWTLRAPAAGKYLLVVRYCSPTTVRRKVRIDSADALTQTWPGTGGFSGDANDWAHTPLTGPDGRPLVLTLGKGDHTVRLTNLDGHGANLDYLAVVSPAEAIAAR